MSRLAPTWATFNPGGGSDEATQTPTYTVTNITNPSLFSQAPAVDSAGNLTFTLTADANGYADFDVQVQDNGGTANGGGDVSSVKTYRITANPVNDAPDFTGSDIFVNEDAGAVTIANWATFTPGGGSDEAAQTALYLVSNPSNPSLFTQAPAVDSAGNPTFTLAANAHGFSTVPVHPAGRIIACPSGGVGGWLRVDQAGPLFRE